MHLLAPSPPPPLAKLNRHWFWDISCLAELIYDLINRQIYAESIPNRWRFNFRPPLSLPEQMYANIQRIFLSTDPGPGPCSDPAPAPASDSVFTPPAAAAADLVMYERLGIRSEICSVLYIHANKIWLTQIHHRRESYQNWASIAPAGSRAGLLGWVHLWPVPRRSVRSWPAHLAFRSVIASICFDESIWSTVPGSEVGGKGMGGGQLLTSRWRTCIAKDGTLWAAELDDLLLICWESTELREFLKVYKY